MQFAESNEGDYRIYVGALEAPGGGGYIAALVVRFRGDGLADLGAAAPAYRDDSVACGYRWPSPAEAIAYAMARGREVVRRRMRDAQSDAALQCLGDTAAGLPRLSASCAPARDA